MGKGKKPPSFKQFQKDGNFKSETDWSTADAGHIRNLIVSFTEAGGALRFGCTRDKGAYAIGVHIGGEHNTIYVAYTEDINVRLLELQNDIDTYSASLEGGSGDL